MRIAFVAALISLVLGISLHSAHAQNTCTALVERALAAVDQNCGGMGRNTACYGYNRVNAAFAQPMPSDFFAAPADVAELLALRGIGTTPLDESADTWGVAVIRAQANLPTTLPGQSVTILLLGGADVQSATPPDAAFIPTITLPVTTAARADIHSGASLNTNQIGVFDVGAALTADARSEDGMWVRAANDTMGGWVAASALAPVDLAPLAVLGADASAPMQAFTFETQIGGLSCADAPNAVLVQGPQGFEITLNVNGAEVNVNSTVQLISMPEAPERILNTLPLPPRIIARLRDHYGEPIDGEVCRIQHLRVISGYARLNDGERLEAGNAGWSAYCLGAPLPAPNENDAGTSSIPDTAAVGSPLQGQIISFISQWGSFRAITQEELDSIQVFERLPASILNYPIELPPLS